MGNRIGKKTNNSFAAPLSKIGMNFYANKLSVESTFEILRKIDGVRSLLQENLLECDMKWTLFVAAADSYRSYAKLTPFPVYHQMQYAGECYSLSELMLLIEDVPPLHLVLEDIAYWNFHYLSIDALILLHWVLIEADSPKMWRMDDTYYEDFMARLGNTLEVPVPTHIFQIDTDDIPLAAGKPQSFAYYSDKLGNFHSILANGFQQHHINLIGSSDCCIILENDLRKCFDTSPISAGWGKSRCGSWLTCIGLCDFVMDQDAREYEENDRSLNTEIKVYGADDVKISYLLVYRRDNPNLDKLLAEIESAPTREPAAKETIKHCNTRKKFYISVAGCMGVVVLLGILNTHCGKYLQQALVSKGRFVFRRMF